MIACCGMAWYWPEPQWPIPRAIWPKVKTKAIGLPIQADINLLINRQLGLILTPGFNQAVVGFTKPLWILLGHYGSAIMGCASFVL